MPSEPAEPPSGAPSRWQGTPAPPGWRSHALPPRATADGCDGARDLGVVRRLAPRRLRQRAPPRRWKTPCRGCRRGNLGRDRPSPEQGRKRCCRDLSQRRVDPRSASAALNSSPIRPPAASPRRRRAWTAQEPARGPATRVLPIGSVKTAIADSLAAAAGAVAARRPMPRAGGRLFVEARGRAVAAGVRTTAAVTRRHSISLTTQRREGREEKREMERKRRGRRKKREIEWQPGHRGVVRRRLRLDLALLRKGGLQPRHGGAPLPRQRPRREESAMPSLRCRSAGPWSRRRARPLRRQARRRRGEAAAADRRGIQRGGADRGSRGAGRDSRQHRFLPVGRRRSLPGPGRHPRHGVPAPRVARAEPHPAGRDAHFTPRSRAPSATRPPCARGQRVRRQPGGAGRPCHRAVRTTAGSAATLGASRGRSELLELEKPAKK